MEKNYSVSVRLFFLIFLTSAAFSARAQSPWLPYFGNTHFGYSTGTFTTGRIPTSVTMADVDNDGDQDAVISKGGLFSGISNQGLGFTVLLNSGNGHFGAPTHYNTGQPSQDLVVGDFTGDTKPDVVISRTGFAPAGNSVALFAGLGGGMFATTPVNYTVGTGPAGLAAADLNADGLLDLAVSNHNDGNGSSVSILYNTILGAFAPAVTVTTASAPFDLAIGNMDSDAMPDIVVAHNNQKFSVLKNAGTGFTADSVYQVLTTNYAGDANPTIVLSDIDMDLDLDVLYSSNRTWDGTSGQIAIRRNSGNGTLGPLQLITMDFYSTGTSSLQAADLNSDGAPDLIASSASGRTGDGYRVLMNNGTGTFGPTVVRPGGQHTGLVAVSKVDYDNLPDVLTIDTYSLELTVHPNQGAGQFITPTLHTAGVNGFAGTIEAADIDNDGDLDIVTSGNMRTTVSVAVTVLKNLGGGTFAPGVNVATAGVQAKLRDLNNDLLPDLLYIGGTGSTGYNFFTAINQGNGTFASPVLRNIGACAPEDIDAADMDGDGDLDVVASGGCNAVIHVSYNQGNAAFNAVSSYPVSAYPGPLALSDFNRDGRPDIAAGTHNGVDVLLANPGTGFQPYVSVSLASNPFDIIATDLNDDGSPDIASCNYGSNPGDYNMTVRLGDGMGGFSPVQTLPAAYSPDLANVSGITTGDIDNDLDMDIMVSNNATNDMSIYLNQGNGVFNDGLRAGLYYSARSPWFADFNNDGHCEIVALVSLPPGGFQSAIATLQGTNSGWRTANSQAVLSVPASVKAAELNFKAAPNPFNRFTSLHFNLKRSGLTTVTLYNLLGQKADQLFINKPLSAGDHVIQVDGSRLSPGMYLAELTTGNEKAVLRIMME